MNYKIWIMICVVCLLIGLIGGTALGMQKGQYMLFEGLNKAFDGAEVNVEINLNETQIVEGMKEIIIPLLNQTINLETQSGEEK